MVSRSIIYSPFSRPTESGIAPNAIIKAKNDFPGMIGSLLILPQPIFKRALNLNEGPNQLESRRRRRGMNSSDLWQRLESRAGTRLLFSF